MSPRSTVPAARVVAAALILFALVFAGREINADSNDGVGLLYAFPVTLLALRFGLVGGIVAAAFAVLLSLVGVAINDDLAISELGSATRFTVVVGIGALVGWFSDRSRRLQALREDGQRKLERFFELSTDLLCTLGPDGHFSDLNPAWEATLGYTDEEIRATPYLELHHPDDRERSEAEAAALAAGDTTIGFESRLVAKDGSIRWLLWSARLDTADGLIYARGTDVTNRRAAEEVVRGLIEAAPDAMVTVDETGIIELVNGRTEELFGYPRDELVGRPVEVLLPAGVRTQIEPWLRGSDERAASTDTRVALGTFGQNRGGRRFPVEVSLSPMTTGAGRYAVAAVRDVSERKREERRLLETASALQRSNEDLEKFASVASHDLAEPLRSIAGFGQLLQKRYGDQIDERGVEYIERMVGGVGRMQLLIRDLLVFSRAGREEVVRDEVDVEELVRQVLDDLQATIDEEEAQIEMTRLPVVRGDREQLGQLFENLIANAIKFSNGGTPRVELTAERDNGGWSFSVADEGIGIPEHHRERVFGAFQRLHPRDEYAGTGIGLAICRRIVQRHGGEIRAQEGLRGRGTTVRFDLPDTER